MKKQLEVKLSLESKPETGKKQNKTNPPKKTPTKKDRSFTE